MGSLKNSEFRSRSKRARKFFRWHIHDIQRIKFDCATTRLAGMTIFQGSLMTEKSTYEEWESGLSNWRGRGIFPASHFEIGRSLSPYVKNIFSQAGTGSNHSQTLPSQHPGITCRPLGSSKISIYIFMRFDTVITRGETARMSNKNNTLHMQWPTQPLPTCGH
jgi:hypothetical protein